MVGTRRRRRPVPVDVLLAPYQPGAAVGSEGLSHEERSRASAIGDEGERDRFYSGRRLLRRALAQHTGRPARELQIASGRNGQPLLLGGGPYFGLAHGDRWYAVALCDAVPVGVAVAPHADQPGHDAVVSALLPPAAREEIEAAATAERSAVTARWWLTMEAAVRACGASRDQAAACLARVTAEIGGPLAEETVAVAGCTAHALEVRWRVLTPEQQGVPA